MPNSSKNALRFLWVGLAALTIGAASLVVGSRQAQRHRIVNAKAEWALALDAEEAELGAQVDQATLPLGEFFDGVAIAGIGGFLGEFTGPWDTPAFTYKWLADKLAFRGYSDRITEKVKGALGKHLGVPDRLIEAINGSVERFGVIQRQRDASLREKAYAIMRGAGIDVDGNALDEMLKEAQESARICAFNTFATDTATKFGLASVPTNLLQDAQILRDTYRLARPIIVRAMLAIATRLGIVTAGTTAAAGTAAVGTATGVGAVPSWILAAGEIAVTTVVDLAAGWWLEQKAANKMREQLNEIRAELDGALRAFMRDYGRSLRAERTALMERMLSR